MLVSDSSRISNNTLISLLVYLVVFPDNECLGEVLCSSRMRIQYDIINIYEILNREKCHRIMWFSNKHKKEEAIIEI